MMWKEKCLGGKRCVRHSLSTDSLYEQKLKLLAASCNQKHLVLGSLIVCYLLDSQSFVYSVQKNYNTIPHFWVTTDYDEEKKIIYKLENKIQENGPILSPNSKYLNFPRSKQLKFSFTTDHDSKIKLLARSCNLTKAEMIALALHYGLDSSSLVMYFQEEYNTNSHFWVTPLVEQGTVSYMLG